MKSIRLENDIKFEPHPGDLTEHIFCLAANSLEFERKLLIHGMLGVAMNAPHRADEAWDHINAIPYMTDEQFKKYVELNELGPLLEKLA